MFIASVELEEMFESLVVVTMETVLLYELALVRRTLVDS